MKKLTAVLITLLFAYSGFCQGYFRVQAGPVFNYLSSDGNTGSFSNLNTSFTAGLAYEMVASKGFSVQPEFNLTYLNAKESITSSDLKFNYIQIPVLLKAVTSKRNFSFYLGPQLSFLTSAKAKTSGNSIDIKDNLTQTDFSGVIGIEYVFTNNISLNARFTQGFSNVYKAEFDSPDKTRHEIFGLTVGYIFTKKK